jgi:hypothetical protein
MARLAHVAADANAARDAGNEDALGTKAFRVSQSRTEVGQEHKRVTFPGTHMVNPLALSMEGPSSLGTYAEPWRRDARSVACEATRTRKRTWLAMQAFEATPARRL